MSPHHPHAARWLCALAISLPAGSAQATNLQCHQDARTDAMHCLDLHQVRERDGIRYARLYTGGPNGVRGTNFSVHSNCATGVVHLKDRDGVSFAGGTGNETAAIRMLREMLCSASVRKK